MVLFPKPNFMKVVAVALLTLSLVLGPLPAFAQSGQTLSEGQQAKLDSIEGEANDPGGLWGLVRRGLQFSPTYQVLMLPGRIVQYFEQRAERRAAEAGYRADTKRKEAAEGMNNWPANTGTNTTKDGTVDAGHGGTKPGSATNPGTGTKGSATGGTVSPGTGGTKGGSSGGGSGTGTGKPTPTDPDEDDKKKTSGASVITAFEEGIAGAVNWVRSVIGF